jgi:hypothetical protein
MVTALLWLLALEAGKRLALDAVNGTAHDGFSVIEDYSVTDTREITTGLSAPEGRVICTALTGGSFKCSEFLPDDSVYHWLSPVDLTGKWPD